MKNQLRRVQRLEQIFAKIEPPPDLASERAGWQAFVDHVVLPAAAANPAALAALAAGLPEIAELAYARPGAVQPGQAGRDARRGQAFVQLGQLLAPYPEVKSAVSELLERKIQEREQAARKPA